MVANEIIEPVMEPSEWCYPIVIVNKPGTNEKRLTVDFKKLNSQVQRPADPMTSPRDAVSDIEPSRFFSTLDAHHGCWQIPLSEAARPFTTFITPWGRYRYLRNPKALCRLVMNLTAAWMHRSTTLTTSAKSWTTAWCTMTVFRSMSPELGKC